MDSSVFARCLKQEAGTFLEGQVATTTRYDVLLMPLTGCFKIRYDLMLIFCLLVCLSLF